MVRKIAVAAYTHNGRVRSNNEDCVAVGNWVQGDAMSAPQYFEQELGLPLVCMVLDGMGGHADGEVASRLSAEYLVRELPACMDEIEISQCIAQANLNLFGYMRTHPSHLGMGTTLAGVRIDPDSVLAFNVGDSRVYRTQDGFLAQLSVDDVQRAPGNPNRSNILTQSLGGTPYPVEIEAHLSRSKVSQPRTYLLCSDGLYDALDLEQIESAINEDVVASAQLLMERSLAAGARDNVSVVLIRVST